MSRVLVNSLNVRTGPSTNTQKVAHYDAGQVIKSGDLIVQNEGRYWLRYTGGSGNKRFVCMWENGTYFVDVPADVSGPRPPPQNPQPIPTPQPIFGGETGIIGIPKQQQFGDSRIQKWGCCFLCTCVKGGLTTAAQCMDCFNWGIQSGKLSNSDCYVKCNKETWAVEISQRYGTPYHGDFIFQKNNHHFWLAQNGREIFNSSGLGWR
jgi:hypothetical protein